MTRRTGLHGAGGASLVAAALVLAAAPALAQAVVGSGGLPVRWEELTAPDFVTAVVRSGGTAIVPLGIVEKQSAPGSTSSEVTPEGRAERARRASTDQLQPELFLNMIWAVWCRYRRQFIHSWPPELCCHRALIPRPWSVPKVYLALSRAMSLSPAPR